MADIVAAPALPPLTLSPGDRVVYPNQGVCRVSAIEVKEVAGQKLTFVTMHREEDGAVVMVPQQKVQTIGLRKVASPDEVQKIFEFLRSDSDKANLDWKQRARTNTDRMNQGSILGLVEVVKGLQVLSELRPLPTKERELYDNARHLLVSELAASLTIAECDAEDSIDIVLFPPGRERPKRTAEEFRAIAPDGEDGLELNDDLLGMGSDLDLPSDEEAPPAEEEEAPAEDTEGEPESSEPAAKRAGRAGAAAASADDGAKRKRGRPPKPKPPVDTSAPPAAPKKRGRPPKPKPAVTEPAVPKKRGRPPKSAADAKKK